jgi:hypothetical protein
MKLSEIRAHLKAAGYKTTDEIDRIDVKRQNGVTTGIDVMFTSGEVAFIPASAAGDCRVWQAPVSCGDPEKPRIVVLANHQCVNRRVVAEALDWNTLTGQYVGGFGVLAPRPRSGGIRVAAGPANPSEASRDQRRTVTRRSDR